MVVTVDRIRLEYKKIEDRLYRLRCHYGYSTVRHQGLRRLEERARRLGSIMRRMETSWGKAR